VSGIPTARLNGELSETLYMKQPPGFQDRSGRGWLLKRPLYGLRQAVNAWWLKFTQGLSSIGSEKPASDPAICSRGEGDTKAYIFIHVDDGLCFGPVGLHAKLRKAFPGRDLGEALWPGTAHRAGLGGSLD
jgi:hypothetical protein